MSVLRPFLVLPRTIPTVAGLLTFRADKRAINKVI